MKKKILGVVLFVGLVSLITIKVDFSEETQYGLFLSNIEALAQSEQPELDCEDDPDTTCISLHPTDESKDKEQENAKWK